jgi:hypothetical protein
MVTLSRWLWAQGEVGHLNKTYVTTYTDMTALADAMFPPIGQSLPTTADETVKKGAAW